MMLKILLVDDHEVVRLGLKSLLSRYPKFEVVAEAGTAEEAIRLSLEYKPDVVVMDIRLPGKSGIEATREITDAQPDSKVIVLTTFADDELLFDAISAGASGYVLKQIALTGQAQQRDRGRSLFEREDRAQLRQLDPEQTGYGNSHRSRRLCGKTSHRKLC
jgi:DNA-binding NarL/FixJ family response regulator